MEKLVRERRSVRTFDGHELTDEDREKLCAFIAQIDNPYCATLGEIFDVVVEDMDRQARGLKG